MISGVILARNEEDNIRACVEVLRPHVGEILLIDMESEDRTIEIARPLVDQILTHELIANFDSARNIAIDRAKFEWLWFVDADERIPFRTGNLVNQLIRDRGREFAAISIPFKTYFCGKWIEHSGWWPGYTAPRVLKKGTFQFSEKLHGGVDFRGKELRVGPDADLGVDHFSYRSVEHYIEKFNRYTSVEADQLADGPVDLDWREGLRSMVQDLWTYYERNHGVLDGIHGWILAWLSGQYRWLSHAKLVDRISDDDPRRRDLSFPPSLDHVLDRIQIELERCRGLEITQQLGVVFHTPLWDYSGYADEARCIAKAMSRSQRHFVVRENRWNDRLCDLPAAEAALYRAQLRGRRARQNIAITNCIPTLVKPDPVAAFNVLRTTFETDRIPDAWHPCLEPFDEIWVISRHNRDAFIRSGVAPEKIQQAPSFLDGELFQSSGPKLELNQSLSERFVFLSVFDWQLRKGWDLLLRAYAESFDPGEGTGLLLKTTRMHGQQSNGIRQRAEAALQKLGQSLKSREDIVFWDNPLSQSDMAALYRSVDAFVLASRGEGWGRPYMEAMACGLPVIGTRASGHLDFMTEQNSFLIAAHQTAVPNEAANEISVYRGHRWFEPDLDELKHALLTVHRDERERNRRAARARTDIERDYDLRAGQARLEVELARIEGQFASAPHGEPKANAIQVNWFGDFFAGHSFSNINEALCARLATDDQFELNVLPRVFAAGDRSARRRWLLRHCNRSLDLGRQVTVRHSFPPEWDPIKSGKWVHIQPWEFGHLPVDWLQPLKTQVDEVWAPSEYVKRVYVQSGIAEQKVQVIPWGVNVEAYSADAVPRLIPTDKRFRFVFVGGTITRKGFDRLLHAYLAEFKRGEDVCLVIKDLGADTFYGPDSHRSKIRDAQADRRLPEITYFEGNWTEGQLASLYRACNCLVMPYRGEGFGLPILEAMACGLPPIVPKGGASDDFVDDENGFRLPSREITVQHQWQLCGPAMQLEIDIEDIQRAMRFAFENQDVVRQRGARAARFVRQRFTWDRTKQLMAARIKVLASDIPTAVGLESAPAEHRASQPTLAACVHWRDPAASIDECLSRLQPFVDELLVMDEGLSESQLNLARDYGANLASELGITPGTAGNGVHASLLDSDWFFEIEATDVLFGEEAGKIKPLVADLPAVIKEFAVDLTISPRGDTDQQITAVIKRRS